MRTTVAIDDEVLAAAKRRARERGESLGEVITAALRRSLQQVDAATDAPRIPVFTAGTGPRPGIDLTSNRTVREALDEGQGLEQLR